MTTTRAERFAELDVDTRRRWSAFGRADAELFVTLLGLTIEDVRVDYCRMRMPFRADLRQGAGVVHGGAIATLLDSVVVPAVGQAYDRTIRYSTVDCHVQFHAALVDHDAIAEGWVVRRGRSTVFCESEAVDATTGVVIARALLTFNVSSGGAASN